MAEEKQGDNQGQKDNQGNVGNEGVPESPEAMRKDLKNKYDKVEGMNKELNTKQIMNEQKLEQVKRDMFRNFFMILDQFNVNVQDRGAIKNFLNQLEQTDPELYDMFVSVFEGISTMPPQEGQQPSQQGQQGQQGQGQQQPQGQPQDQPGGKQEGPSLPDLNVPEDAQRGQESSPMTQDFDNLV